jgi:hypothetical protein
MINDRITDRRIDVSDAIRDLTTGELESVSAGQAMVLATGQGLAVFSLATLLYTGRVSTGGGGCPAGCTCA